MKNIFRLVRSGGLLFELIARSRRSRLALLFCALMLMILCCFLLIDGCSKNSPTAPSDNTTILQGNQAFHAGAVAGYQAVGAGVSYPFKALQLASPTGSAIRSLATTNLFSSTNGSKALMRTSRITDSLAFVPLLNLYGSDRFNGNVFTLFFYSDAAGTQSAGDATITLPTSTTDPLDPTSYGSYPANITIAINVTGGNLPCTGNLVISFTGGTGANTMTGTNTLTRDNVVFSLNLTLDDHFNVSGSVTITESGATIEATNVKGKLNGSLTCDVKINPYGWTGTGILNLVTGSMTANVNTGSGTSTATSDSLGSLNINYADGTHEIVVNPLSGGLASANSTSASITATSGSSQSAAISTAFSSPLIATVKDQSNNLISGAIVTFTAPSSGQSCTFTGGVTKITATTNAQGQAQVGITANATVGSYNVTASVAGVATTATFSLTNTNTSSNPNAVYYAPLIYTSSQRTIVTINNNGQSIGNLGSSTKVPVYWPTPTAQPNTLQIPIGDTLVTLTGLNDNGEIVGYGYTIAITKPYRAGPIYWSSSTAQPQKLAVPSDTNDAEVYATSINNSGHILGYGSLIANNSEYAVDGLYWASATAQPQMLQRSAAVGSGVSKCKFYSTDQIIGTVWTQFIYSAIAFWPSPTAQPITTFTYLSGDYGASPWSVNATGILVGISVGTQSGGSSAFHAVTWASVTASPQALPVLAGTSADWSYANSINTAGAIVGLSSTGVGTIWKNGQAQDLNNLIPSGSSQILGEAKLITDQGWILGYIYATSQSTQYILIPK